MRRVLSTVAASLALVFAAAPAASADFLGVAADPAGDAADPSPGRDIVAAGIVYDRRAGTLRGGIRLRGVPEESNRGFIALFAGVRTGSGCNGYPAIGFASYSDEWGASWARLSAPGQGPSAGGDAAKVGYGSPVQEFEVTAGSLAGQRLDCVIATISEPGVSTNVYDAAGPIPLRGMPALEAQLGRVPGAVKPGQRHRIKLRLTNPGDAPTGRIRLSVRGARGLRAKVPRRLASIRPGKRRTVTILASLGKRARSTTPLHVVARAGKLWAEDEEALHLLRVPPGGGGGGGDFKPQLCNEWQPDISGESGGSLQLVPC